MFSSLRSSLPAPMSPTGHHRVVIGVAGIALGTVALAALLRACASFESDVIAGTPWGSAAGMGLLMAGLTLYVALSLNSGLLSASGIFGAAIVAWLAVFFWPLAADHIFDVTPIADNLAWSPLIPGLATTILGACYACWSARRSGAHYAAHEARAPYPSLALGRRLYPIPKTRSYAWIVSLILSIIGVASIVIPTLILSSNIYIIPGNNVISLNASTPSPILLITLASFGGAVMAISASWSIFGPITCSIFALLIPSAWASMQELFTLGRSLTRESSHDITVASPLLGVWGAVIIVMTLAAHVARKEGYARASTQLHEIYALVASDSHPEDSANASHHDRAQDSSVLTTVSANVTGRCEVDVASASSHHKNEKSPNQSHV